MLTHKKQYAERAVKTELSDRKERILSAIIERFISTGEPVGSKLLAATLSMAVSSATIRNEMAELSENGYLDQPHTSAGRIPSDKGYRYYIDKLLQNYAPSDADMFRIQSAIDHTEGDAEKVLTQACDVLAELTGCAAAATTPQSEGAVIKRTEVVPMGEKTAMVVVMTSAGVLKSRICRLTSEINYELLELFYNISASNFIGFPARSITQAKIQSVVASLEQKAIDITPLVVSFYEAVSNAADSDVIVSGHSNLLNCFELGTSAVQIIELLRNRETVISLLGSASSAPVELKIGNENEFGCMRRAALVKADYLVGENNAGIIGVIGPTKMDYSRIIPLVKYVSAITGTLLTGIIDL